MNEKIKSINLITCHYCGNEMDNILFADNNTTTICRMDWCSICGTISFTDPNGVHTIETFTNMLKGNMNIVDEPICDHLDGAVCGYRTNMASTNLCTVHHRPPEPWCRWAWSTGFGKVSKKYCMQCRFRSLNGKGVHNATDTDDKDNSIDNGNT